ncbi:MAG TPA: DUF4331 family protein [Flavobacteriaceae bacterium]|nr:DUF4331 family protein [Flavobacteriaceae bacterium]
MKKYILRIAFITIALLFVQCAEDDNDNIIDPDPTCEDGIQNGDEEGIDCGGSFCPPCEEDTELDFSGIYSQEDQVGKPGSIISYVTYGLRDTYNTTVVSELATQFTDNIVFNIKELNPDYTTNIHGQDSITFANYLTADALWVAQSGSMTYADANSTFTGRKLQDDVMDYNLLMLFGGPDANNPLNDGSDEQPLLISDGVDANDKPFLPDFPYLAAPH